MSRHLVRVRGADALSRRAELLPPTLTLVEPVEERVVRHEQVRAIGDAQIRRADAVRLEIAELLAQHLQIDDRAWPDDAKRVRIEDPRWHEMQLERPVLVHDGVPGVVATLVPDDHIRLLREEVGDLPFALVAPLGTDAGRHGPVNECYGRARGRPGARGGYSGSVGRASPAAAARARAWARGATGVRRSTARPGRVRCPA